MSKQLSRDRLGHWGTSSDSEVAGNITGFERLRNGRYNKVNFVRYPKAVFLFYYFFFFD